MGDDFTIKAEITMRDAAKKLIGMGFKVFLSANKTYLNFTNCKSEGIGSLRYPIYRKTGTLSSFSEFQPTAIHKVSEIVDKDFSTRDMTIAQLNEVLERSTQIPARSYESADKWLDQNKDREKLTIYKPDTGYIFVPYDPIRLEGLSKDEILLNIKNPKVEDENLILTMTLTGENQDVMYFHKPEEVKDAIQKGLTPQEKEEMYLNAAEGSSIDKQKKFAEKILAELNIDPIHVGKNLNRGWFFDLVIRAEEIITEERKAIPSLMNMSVATPEINQCELAKL